MIGINICNASYRNNTMCRYLCSHIQSDNSTSIIANQLNKWCFILAHKIDNKFLHFLYNFTMKTGIFINFWFLVANSIVHPLTRTSDINDILKIITCSKIKSNCMSRIRITISLKVKAQGLAFLNILFFPNSN